MRPLRWEMRFKPQLVPWCIRIEAENSAHRDRGLKISKCKRLKNHRRVERLRPEDNPKRGLSGLAQSSTVAVWVGRGGPSKC
jgi:hypothetical protein